MHQDVFMLMCFDGNHMESGSHVAGLRSRINRSRPLTLMERSGMLESHPGTLEPGFGGQKSAAGIQTLFGNITAK